MLNWLGPRLRAQVKSALGGVAYAAGAGDLEGELLGHAVGRGAWIFYQLDSGERTVTLVGTAQVRSRLATQVVPKAYLPHVRGRAHRGLRIRPRRRPR